MLVGRKWYRAVWLEGSTVKMIDQPKLPWKFSIASFQNHRGTAKAIREMVVRGAGSIGAAAAYGAAQVVMEAGERNFSPYTKAGFERLRKTRPTAQDLLPVVREEVASVRDRLLVVADGLEQAIRTPAWYLRESGGAEEDAAGVELFAKPDDRSEVNDVSDRCHDVVEGLREVFVQSERFLQTGQIGDLPPLEETLVRWVE